MKRLFSTIIALAIFFLIFLWMFSSRETNTDINLFGAGYVTLLVAIYLMILGIGNPDYPKMWWSIPDDATPKQRWGFSIGNFLLTMTLCRATLDLPRESLSDISITLYASLPVFIVIMAFIVRRLIIKKNSDYSEN